MLGRRGEGCKTVRTGQLRDDTLPTWPAVAPQRSIAATLLPARDLRWEADPFTAIAGGGRVTAQTYGEKEVANAPAARARPRLPGFLSAPAFRARHAPPVRLSHPALRQLTFVVGYRPFVPARVAAPHHRHRRAADRVLGAHAAYDAAMETLFGQSQA